MGSLVENVSELLEVYPNTRGDDRLLIATYWRKFDNLQTLNLDFVYNSTPSESITRARRLIQSQGKYLPTEEILSARKEREKQFKENIKNGVVV